MKFPSNLNYKIMMENRLWNEPQISAYELLGHYCVVSL